MAQETDINSTLEHIVQELREIKKAIISSTIEKRDKTNKAWKDLMEVRSRITKMWRGASAVEEIRQQREKIWQHI